MDNQMASDDSTLVDDILNEMNGPNTQATPQFNNTPSNFTVDSNAAYIQQQQQQINRQIDPALIQPPENQISQVSNQTHTVNNNGMTVIEYPNKESKISRILNMIKRPVIIMCLVFIFFNPVVLTKLGQYIPSIFNTNGIMWKAQLRAGILAFIIGMSYLGLNLLM